MFQRSKKKIGCHLRALDATFCHSAMCALVGQCGGAQRLIGKTKGGWTTKLSIVVDMKGRIHGLRIDPGNCADITAGLQLAQYLKEILLLADKGYDAKELRELLDRNGCLHNIPQRSTAKLKLYFNKELYKSRHVVENVFCKAKWWDRITTRRERRGDHAAAWPTLFATMTWFN
jgi:transposase